MTQHMRRGARGAAMIAALAMTGSLVACAGGDSGGSTGDSWLDELDPITLRIADWTSGDAATGLYGQAIEAWAERVEEATDGKVTAEYYYGTSLLNATDALPGLQGGVADISVINSVYYPAELPVGTWMAGLGAHATGSVVHDIGAGSAMAFEWSQTFEPLLDEWRANGLHPLMTVSSAPYPLICNEPVETLADARGKLGRSSGDAWTPTIEALGMSTVNIAYNEIYEGLQRGVIDCVTINANQLVSSLTLKDVAPYYHPVAFSMWQATNFMMNLELWESFPVELQRIMQEEAGQAAHDVMNRFIELEALAGDAFVDGSATIVAAPELQDAADASRAEILANLVDSAPASVTDPAMVVQEYSDDFDAWVQFLVDEGYELPGRDVDSVLAMFESLPETDYTALYEKLRADYIESSLP